MLCYSCFLLLFECPKNLPPLNYESLDLFLPSLRKIYWCKLTKNFPLKIEVNISEKRFILRTSQYILKWYQVLLLYFQTNV